METKDVKELIIQKKESYNEIIDENKKENADKTFLLGISLVSLVGGLSGLIQASSVKGIGGVLGSIASLAAMILGAYSTTNYTPDYVRNLVTIFKLKLEKRKLDLTLETIDSLDTNKTKKKTK